MRNSRILIQNIYCALCGYILRTSTTTFLWAILLSVDLWTLEIFSQHLQMFAAFNCQALLLSFFLSVLLANQCTDIGNEHDEIGV